VAQARTSGVLSTRHRIATFVSPSRMALASCAAADRHVASTKTRREAARNQAAWTDHAPKLVDRKDNASPAMKANKPIAAILYQRIRIRASFNIFLKGAVKIARLSLFQNSYTAKWSESGATDHDHEVLLPALCNMRRSTHPKNCVCARLIRKYVSSWSFLTTRGLSKHAGRSSMKGQHNR